MRDSLAHGSQETVARRAPAPADRLIRLDDVSVSASGIEILSSLRVDIGRGAPILLVGPNGAGKTTFLKLLMGLIAPTSGSIVHGTGGRADVPIRSLVFQRPVMLRRTVEANVAYALKAAGRSATRESIYELLHRVALRHLAERPARRLSAGEQQRLALARALAREPDLLLLDEPTASLDPSSTKAVEDIVADVARDGVKVVMTTHDLGQVRRIGGEVLLLVGGRIAERESARQFLSAPRSEHGRRFLAGGLVM